MDSGTNNFKENLTLEKHCNDFSMKDISVKLTRMPSEADTCVKHSCKKKKIYNPKRWKFRNSKRKTFAFEKLQTQETEENIESTIEATSKSSSEKTDKHMHFDEQSCKKEKYLRAQDAQTKAEIFTLSKYEAQNKEESWDDKPCVSARTLSYEVHRKIIPSSASSNNVNAKISTNSSLLSLHNRYKNRQKEDDKTSMSKYDLYHNKTNKKLLRKLIRKKFKYVSKTNSVQNQLDKWKFKKKIDLFDEELYELPASNRKCRKILSDTSDEDTTTSNIKIICNNNRRELLASHDRVDEEKSRTNIQITQEARIILIKLEELDDIDAIKWRKKMNASKMIVSKPLVKKQQVDKSKIMIDSNKSASECNKKSLHVKKQIKNPIALKQIYQSDRLILPGNAFLAEKTKNNTLSQLMASNNVSDMKKIRKKYKLFKKPKVLMIKLETLQNFSKDGRYSADEINRLTKKYINSVIKFNSDKSLHRHVHRKKDMINVTRTADNVSSSILTQRMDNSLERLDEKDSTEDVQVTDNSNTNNAFKIRINCKSMSIIPSSQNNLSPLNASKKKKDLSQKTQEIWQNAFCTQKSVKKLQEKSPQQSTSLQSMIEATSIPRNLLKKSADVEHKSVSKLKASTSTSSKRNNTLTASPEKCVFPKKYETTAKSTPPTKSKETSKSELSVTDTNSSDTANREETVSLVKNALFQSEDNTIKRSQKKIVKNVLYRCDMCDILLENSRQLQIHKKSGGCKTSVKKSSSIGNVSELAMDKVNKHSSTQSSQRSSVKDKKSVSNKIDQSFGHDKQIVSPFSSKINELSSNIMATKMKINKFLETKLNLDSQSKSRLQNIFLESSTPLKCNVCFKVFNTYMQLYKHIHKHSNLKLRNAYIKSAGNKSNDKAFKNTKNSKVVETDSGKSAEVIDKRENINELHTEPRIHEVSQDNLSKEANKTLSLSEKQVLSAASSAEGKKNCLKICECHKTVKINENNSIQIEIVILCKICMILFRRLECFETHCQHSTKCKKNQRFSRKPMLLCGHCHEAFDNILSIWYHVKTHFSSNWEIVATLYCNICKVIFYAPGPYFYNHFQHHLLNPYFLTSRMSFPKRSYIGSKLVQLPNTDGNVTSLETYIVIADFVCQECKTLFMTEQTLMSHDCQSNAACVDNNTSSEQYSKVATKKARILLVCGFCNETFYNRVFFEQHSLDHKMKRNIHSLYVCVAVTAVTSVFICKVCMIMSKSLKTFEKHWLTHGMLQEDYVCSLCEKHFETIDLFQEHAITHVNSNEKQQEPISCKVIYRDIDNQNCEKNLHISDNEDLLRTNLNCFPREKSIESTASNKSCKKSSMASTSQNVLDERSNELLVKNITAQANKNDEDIPQVASMQPKRAIKNNKDNNNMEDISNNVTNKNDNLEALDDSEEERLTIVMSESEESVSEIKKKIHECSSKRKIAGENATRSSFSTDEQKFLNNLDLMVDVEISSNASSNFNKNSNNKTLRESTTQLDASSTSISKDNKIFVGDKIIKCSTATTMTAAATTTATAMTAMTTAMTMAPTTVIKTAPATAMTTTPATVITTAPATAIMTAPTTTMIGNDHAIKNSSKLSDQKNVDCPAALNLNDSNKHSKKLPENVMSVVPKYFLRVKSLAELTNAIEERCLCHLCALQFDSMDKLNEHLLKIHKISCGSSSFHPEQNNQVLNDTRVKAKLNPPIVMSTMQTKNRPLYSTVYSNAPLSNSASSSNNALKSGSIFTSNNMPRFDNSHLQLPNQIIDQTKCLAPNLYCALPSNLKNVSTNKNQNGFHLIMNNSVSATHSQQSQQLRQSQQLQQPQQLRQSQQLQQPQQLRQSQQLLQLRQLRPLQQSQQLRQLQQSLQKSQQQQQNSQMQIYHQNLPHCIAQPINRTGQFLQQQQQKQQQSQSPGTVTVKPFMQTTYQASRPLYLQEQQQKQMNGNDNIYGYVNVSYPLESNNVMPANSNNVVFIPSNTIQQSSQDPKHFAYYPNF